MSDVGGVDWVEEYADLSCAPLRLKRKLRTRKKAFVGWGSRELIEFLESVGRDTSRVIPQHDVVRIITSYVNDNGLINPAKKKRIFCDERLLFLFGKKSIGKNKIHDLLGAHYAENNKDEDEGEDLLWGSDDDDASEKHTAHISDGTPQPKRRVVERPKGCFAAIVPENFKLVYLRRSLVGDLMKDLDTFEEKVVGSFVRTKSDPNDFLQKNPFLISEVTGVKMTPRYVEADTQVLFQVAGLIKDVPLSKLSDDNFTEEECGDLHRRVDERLLKRPTIAGLEAKARVLHEDITRNWLSRELAKVETLIDRANEKGWRKELSEYLDRRKLLRSPDEQSRLLAKMPKVIADALELDPATTANNIQEDDGETNDSPAAVLERSLEMTKYDASSKAEALLIKPSSKVSAGGIATPELHHRSVASPVNPLPPAIAQTRSPITSGIATPKLHHRSVASPVNPLPAAIAQTQSPITQFWFPVLAKESKEQSVVDLNQQVWGVRENGNSADTSSAHSIAHINPPVENLRNEDRPPVEDDKSLKLGNNNNGLKSPMIDLTCEDDEEIEIERPRSDSQQINLNLSSMGWHYLDPQGNVQGPFTLELLQSWSDAGYFPKDFKVWMTGQDPNNAVKLSEILFRQMFLK